MSAHVSFVDDATAIRTDALECPWCHAEDVDFLNQSWAGVDDAKTLRCGRCGERFLATVQVSVQIRACRGGPPLTPVEGLEA